MKNKTGASVRAQFPGSACQGQYLAMSPQKGIESIGLRKFVLKEKASGNCVVERLELSRQGKGGQGKGLAQVTLSED